MNKRIELLKLLAKKKLISKENFGKLESELKNSKLDLDAELISRKIVNKNKLLQTKAELFDMKFQDLSNVEIEGPVLNIIPMDVAENYKIVSFERKGNFLKVGVVNPEDYKAHEVVSFLAIEAGLDVEYTLISLEDFYKVSKQYKKFEDEIGAALETKAKSDSDEVRPVKISSEVLSDDISEAPVAKIVSVIIKHAVDGGASDIHIEPLPQETRIRYRIDGILHTSLILPKSVHNSVVARIKVMAKLKLDETRVPQDGRIRMAIDNREIDFRISTLPLIGYEKVVMRILDPARGLPGLEELGFNHHSLEIIKDNILRTSGILLVTGPTGSGKTTSLYSVLNIVNKEGVNISTLEDPIEYNIKGINQSQIKPKVGYTFATGLRSFLRQDPDIIMVGEVRDNETAELAVHAGLTGHFVLSTLHTNDAMGAINRLFDMNVEPFLLGSTLNAVVAQRLVRKLCIHCRKKVQLPAKIIEDLTAVIKELPIEVIKNEVPKFPGFDKLKDMEFYEAVGCVRCNNTGFSGRIAMVEIIQITPIIREIIIEHHKDLKLEQIKQNQLFISMKQDGVIKVLNQVTSFEEILRVIND